MNPMKMNPMKDHPPFTRTGSFLSVLSLMLILGLANANAEPPISSSASFTLLSAEEISQAASVERFIGKKVERRRVDGFEYHYTTLLDDDAPTPEKLAKVFSRRKRGKSRRRRK